MLWEKEQPKLTPSQCDVAAEAQIWPVFLLDVWILNWCFWRTNFLYFFVSWSWCRNTFVIKKDLGQEINWQAYRCNPHLVFTDKLIGREVLSVVRYPWCVTPVDAGNSHWFLTSRQIIYVDSGTAGKQSASCSYPSPAEVKWKYLVSKSVGEQACFCLLLGVHCYCPSFVPLVFPQGLFGVFLVNILWSWEWKAFCPFSAPIWNNLTFIWTVHCVHQYLADRRKSCYENVSFLRAAAEERLAITSVFRTCHQ